MIYLDNSATTPLADEVREAMMPYLEGEFGNASSVHTLGVRARVALDDARETIARAINAEPKEIIFTSGGTEANNTAIKSALFRHYREHFAGKPWSDLHILTSRAEHQAVLQPIEWMEKIGAVASYADVDSFGRIIIESVAQKLTPETALASFMLVNNETGAISPIKEIAELVKSKTNAVVHTDAVQALGKIPVDIRELGVDLLSLSAHKIHGPKGIGALYARTGFDWESLIHGGSQERNRRGGTEAVALAVGFAAAVKLMAGHEVHFRDLRNYLLTKLRDIPEVVLNSATDDTSVDAIVNLTFIPEVLARLDADALIIRFDLVGVAISNGSACTSGSAQPSHVLLACGKGDEVANKSIRVSFSRYNTFSDIDKFIEAIRKIIPR